MGNINAPTATVEGDVSLDVGVRQLTLGGAVSSAITIAGGPPNKLSLGSLNTVTIASNAAIQSLAVNDCRNSSISTAWIGSIHSTHDFGANLSLSLGVGGRNLGLKSVVIGGSLLPCIWSIQANVGSIQAADVAGGWSGSIHGTLGSFIDSGDFLGDLAAHGIGGIRVAGNLSGAVILAGADFGADGVLGNNDDFFGSGILSSLIVNGNVNNSFVASGILPVDDNLFASGATLLHRSAIRSLSVLGSVDGASKFVSASLPAKVRVEGAVIPPGGDPNFDL